MCETFILENTSDSIAKFNWFLANGYTVVDRFQLPYGWVIMVKKPDNTFTSTNPIR